MVAERVRGQVAEDLGEGTAEPVPVGRSLVEQVGRLIRLASAVVPWSGVGLQGRFEDVGFELGDGEPALDHAVIIGGSHPELGLSVCAVFLVLEGLGFESVGPLGVEDLYSPLGSAAQVVDGVLLCPLDQVRLHGGTFSVVELVGKLGHGAGDDPRLLRAHARQAHRLTGAGCHGLQLGGEPDLLGGLAVRDPASLGEPGLGRCRSLHTCRVGGMRCGGQVEADRLGQPRDLLHLSHRRCDVGGLERTGGAQVLRSCSQMLGELHGAPPDTDE
jgi:hypothetical protein